MATSLQPLGSEQRLGCKLELSGSRTRVVPRRFWPIQGSPGLGAGEVAKGLPQPWKRATPREVGRLELFAAREGDASEPSLLSSQPLPSPWEKP